MNIKPYTSTRATTSDAAPGEHCSAELGNRVDVDVNTAVNDASRRHATARATHRPPGRAADRTSTPSPSREKKAYYGSVIARRRCTYFFFQLVDSMVAGSGERLPPPSTGCHIFRSASARGPRRAHPRLRVGRGCSRRGTPTRAAPRRRISGAPRASRRRSARCSRGTSAARSRCAFALGLVAPPSPRGRRAIHRLQRALRSRGRGSHAPRAPAAPSLSREGCPLFKRADPSRVDACSPPPLYPSPLRNPLCRSSARQGTPR